jgi:hypothetical protein
VREPRSERGDDGEEHHRRGREHVAGTGARRGDGQVDEDAEPGERREAHGHQIQLGPHQADHEPQPREDGGDGRPSPSMGPARLGTGLGAGGLRVDQPVDSWSCVGRHASRLGGDAAEDGAVGGGR